jgi:hypothetical protein
MLGLNCRLLFLIAFVQNLFEAPSPLNAVVQGASLSSRFTHCNPSIAIIATMAVLRVGSRMVRRLELSFSTVLHFTP